MPILTPSELFHQIADYDKPDCLQPKVAGQPCRISTRELIESVHRLAAALADLGVEAGDRVALMAENGSDRSTVDFATLWFGGVASPLYPTLTPDQAPHSNRDCGARVLFALDRDRLEAMLTNDSTIEPGELTHTQKVNRRVNYQKLGPLIDEMYYRVRERHSQ